MVKISLKMTACSLLLAFNLSGCMSVSDGASNQAGAKDESKPETIDPNTVKPIEEKPQTISGEQGWRNLKVNSITDTSSRSDRYVAEKIRAYEGQIPFSEWSNESISEISPFDKDENAEIGLNITEIGKNLNHTYQGSIVAPSLKGSLVEYDLTTQKWTKQSVDKINYIFRNTPYASYGAMFTNGNDVVYFTTALNNRYTNDGEENAQVKSEDLPYANNDGELRYRKEVVERLSGKAEYTGKVIASVRRYVDSADAGFTSYDITQATLPTEDGTVHLTADWANKTISGEIDSKLLNKKIMLEQSEAFNLQRNTLTTGAVSLKESEFNEDESRYQAKFVGESAKGVVGEVKLAFSHEELKPNDPLEYRAVFGAELKEPTSTTTP